MIYTNFMKKLQDKLNEKNLNPNTIKKYIQNLYILNNKEEFNNLNFLKNIDNIKLNIDNYKLNTQMNMIASILTVLKSNPKGFTKTIKEYDNLFNSIVEQIRKQPNNTKTENQKENWIDWSTIMEKHEELKNFVEDNIKNKKDITTKKYNKLLDFFILSLYTLIPPRRNLDYQKMLIVKKYNNELNDKFNYLDLKTKTFIFNNYKTSKKYGQQKIELENYPKFLDALNIFLKYSIKKENDEGQIYLLQNIKGEPLDRVNSITRILNNIFDKKIGASMLRHIYLTHKYDNNLDERKEDAQKMGHSIEEQTKYIKNDD